MVGPGTDGVTAPAPMGLNGQTTRSQGENMGLPFRTLLDEAPAEAPEVDFENTDDGGSEGGHGESEGDDDLGPRGHQDDDPEAHPDEEEGPQHRREAQDSKSKLISKLKARDRELTQLRRSERAKDRELTQLRESAKAGPRTAIDRRDPGGSLVRLLRETFGDGMDVKAFNSLAKEHLTDALIDVQPELAESDMKLRSRRDQRMTEHALSEERAELRRMAEEAKAERERFTTEAQQSQQEGHARSEVKRFIGMESAAFPYLAVIPTAAEDLYEVLDEMSRRNEHDFGPGPGQARRITDGFRLGAKRLNEYHKRQAEIYGKVRGRSADREDTTGKTVSPGKSAAVRGQQQQQTRPAAGVRPRATRPADDEPDPRLKFSEFVEQQERAKRMSRRGR